MGGTTATTNATPLAGSLCEGSLPRPGDVVAGKYRILRVLGAGGMGIVVEAEHAELRQRVALKFLHPKVADLEVPVARLLREARAACSIRSEHVARVLDIGTLDGGSPYLVMEYLTGTDLRVVLGRRGRLPIEDAVDFILQACEALAEAHSLGIVHRDIKPSNLFLTTRADGSPLIKVLDFGIAKLVRTSPATPPEDTITLTGHGNVVGSPRYTPPERLRDPTVVNERTDIWALGIVLAELLTSESPFEAKTVSSLYYKVAAEPPTSVRKLRPDVPEGLEQAIMRCLEKDPDKRTRDVAELASALRPFAPERSETSVRRVIRMMGDTTVMVGPDGLPISIAAGEGTEGPRGALSSVASSPTLKLPSRRGAAFGLLGAGLLVAGAMVLMLGRPAPSPVPDKPSFALVGIASFKEGLPAARCVAKAPATTDSMRPASTGTTKSVRPASGKRR